MLSESEDGKCTRLDLATRKALFFGVNFISGSVGWKKTEAWVFSLTNETTRDEWQLTNRHYSLRTTKDS